MFPCTGLGRSGRPSRTPGCETTLTPVQLNTPNADSVRGKCAVCVHAAAVQARHGTSVLNRLNGRAHACALRW